MKYNNNIFILNDSDTSSNDELDISNTKAPIKMFCISKKCKTQPKNASYYNYSDISKATFGDILYKDTEKYIVNKNIIPELLDTDSNDCFKIPDKYLKDLGIFYWSLITKRANLCKIYNKTHFEKIKINLDTTKTKELKKEYGNIIINELILKVNILDNTELADGLLHSMDTSVSKPVIKPLISIKKPVIKKATVKKATVKKATVKKATVKKATVKKATVKKASKKPVVKKASKKPVVKKVSKKPVVKKASKKAMVNKATVKKASKKPVVKKPVVKKATVKKASKKATVKKASKKATVQRKGCYEAMNKKELLQKAIKRNISQRYLLTKQQLINRLRKNNN